MQEIAATLEVISVNGFNGAEIDTSEETGMPVGTKFKCKHTALRAIFVWILFQLTSPITGSCGIELVLRLIGVYANLSGNQLASNQVYGRGNDAIFVKASN